MGRSDRLGVRPDSCAGAERCHSQRCKERRGAGANCRANRENRFLVRIRGAHLLVSIAGARLLQIGNLLDMAVNLIRSIGYRQKFAIDRPTRFLLE